MFSLDRLLISSDCTICDKKRRKKIIEKIVENPAKQKEPMHVRMIVTPEISKYWLENFNLHNRPITEATYIAIACDIIDGRWFYNGSPISFCREGWLSDGQTRLKAIIECNIGVESGVEFGLKPEAQGVQDINRVRRAGDFASLAEVENANEACAVASMLLMHERFGINHTPKSFALIEHTADGKKASIKWSRPTKQEIVKAAQEMEGLADAVTQLRRWRNRLLPPRIIGFCFYLFSHQNHGLALDFFDQALMGENLKPNTATQWLHNRLIVNKGDKRRILPIQLIALIFKAWIAFRDNKEIRTLKWGSGAGEEFPKI